MQTRWAGIYLNGVGMSMKSAAQIECLITFDAVAEIIEGPTHSGNPKNPIEPRTRSTVIEECAVRLRQLIRQFHIDCEVRPVTKEQAKSLKRFWLKISGAISAWDKLDVAAKEFVLTNFEFADQERFQALGKTVIVDDYFDTGEDLEFETASYETREQVIKTELQKIQWMAEPGGRYLPPFLVLDQPVQYALRQLIFRLAVIWKKRLNRKVTFNHDGSSQFEIFVRNVARIANINNLVSEEEIHSLLRKLKNRSKVL